MEFAAGTTTPVTATVCILDDDAAVLGFLKMVIQQQGFEVRAFQDPQSLNQEQAAAPDCLIVDWQLQGADGLQVISDCQDRWPETSMILISGQATIPVAVTAMRQGVLTVLEKPVSPENLRREVNAAVLATAERRKAQDKQQQARSLLATLTDNERQVLEMLVQGTANKRMATQMDLSMRTIEKYRASVFNKLGVQSAAEATQVWIKAKNGEAAGGQ